MTDLTNLNETYLRQFIDNCPKCGKELKPYTPLPGLSPSKAYCPSCDILRMHVSVPYLCVNCNSTEFYNDDRYIVSEIDRLIVEKYSQLYDKESFFALKGFVFRKDLGDEERNRLLEEIKKLQERRPKEICWYCGSTEFIGMKTDKLYEMEKKGELKIGYYISKEFVPVGHNCKNFDTSSNITRVTKNVFIAICNCGYEEYVLIPEWQQEEIKEVKIMKREIGEGESLDKITVEDIEMTQKIPIITFKDDKDLLDKVKKVVRRHENT